MWDLNNEFLNCVIKFIGTIMIVGNSILLLTVLVIWIPTQVDIMLKNFKKKDKEKNGDST